MHINPGGGSLILQVLAAGVSAVATGVRRVRDFARKA
jgi:hypothetical protein